MAKLSIAKGSTSVLVRVFIQDSGSTTGAGKTGLTAASFTGTKVYVARDDDGNAGGTAVTLTDATRGTWSSGGIKEKDATNMPGVYEFGLTNASLVTGSRSCTYEFIGTGIAPCLVEIELTGSNNQVVTGDVNVATILGQAPTLDSNNALNVSAKYWAGTAITATSIPVATAAGSSGGLPKIGTAPFPASGTIAAAVADEVNTGATHNVTNSLGKQIRLINPNSDVIYSSTLPSQSGVTSTQVKLDTGASSVDNAYQFGTFSAVAGTGQGSRYCLSYVGSTRLATLDTAWTVAPVAADVVEITPTNKTQLVNPPGIRRNVALANFTFPMISNTDHVSRVSGATVTVTLALDGAAFAGSTNSATEIGATGDYKINLAAADLNAAVVCFKAVATACDDTQLTICTQP